MTTYLFDTNAIQGISRQTLLSTLEEGHRMLLSPMSFWELACHLDGENFQLARGNARKALLCEILHDPLAEIMIDVGCQDMVHPGRFEDQAGAQAILEKLEEVHSYPELMARQAFLGGEMQQIGDFAENIRNALDEDRRSFVDGMRTRCNDYITSFGRDRAINLDGSDFCEAAIGLARTLQAETVQHGCNVPFRELAKRTLLGAGYSVARACAYIGSIGDGQEPVIDGNDLEDYFICLHLGISADRTFVTNDTGVRIALNRTITTFEEYITSSGIVFEINARIITTDEFKVETGHTG